MIFSKKQKEAATKLEVIEEKEGIHESTLNIEYLNEVNEEPPIECMGIKYIDKRKIENEAIKQVNALSAEEKENIGIHLRPIIKLLINEEYKNLLMEQNAIKVNIVNDDVDEFSGKESDVKESNIFSNEADFITALKQYEPQSLSMAYIFASNRSLVEKRYGSQASKNISDTIISKLKAIFTEMPIFANGDEYMVCSAFDYQKLLENLNTFREAIYSVNTSNEFKFPIELDIFDSDGKGCSAVEELILAVKNDYCEDEEDLFEDLLKEEVEEKVQREEKKQSLLSYQVEYIDENEIDKESHEVLASKALSDFPTVVINAVISDKVLNNTTKVRLTINLLDKSESKQEIVVSGNIGMKDILLMSDYNDDKSTLLLDEKMGFILRFGSSIKTFILKDKKDRYDLWQDISKNTFEKTPLQVSGMFICPISNSMAAFIYTRDNQRQLIKTDETCFINMDGVNYRCKNDGTTFEIITENISKNL